MNRRTRLWMCLLAGALLFIWGNSLLPADLSGALSGWLHDVLTAILPGGTGASGGDGLLRKLAHFTEFALLGGVLCRLFRIRGESFPVSVALSLGCGFFAACVDELLQHFSPGRAPSFRDVCIDFAGVLVGTLLYLAGAHVRKIKQNKQLIGGKRK